MIKLSSAQELEVRYIEKSQKALATLLNRKDIGFHQLTIRNELWTQVEKRTVEIKSSFSKMIILGIGGSSLGGKALREALQLKNLSFFENVDSKDFWDSLHSLSDLSKIHWVIVSKSGKTVETLTQANFVYEFLKKNGIELSKCSTVISELKDNPLSTWARKNNVPVLEIPEDVGGRFSVLTAVGLLPCAFAGMSLGDIRSGAQEVLQNTALVSKLTGHYLKSFENEKWISIFWTYCNRLKNYGLWIEQLWAESLGKKLDRAGKPAPRASIPISLIGANDQHSVLQQIAEGPKDKFVTFIRVKESENTGPSLKANLFEGEGYVVGKTMGDLLAAEATATQKALLEEDIPSISLEIERIDGRTLGGLFMLYQLVVGAIGEANNINAFDQPGVELGKRLAKEILSK